MSAKRRWHGFFDLSISPEGILWIGGFWIMAAVFLAGVLVGKALP